jgi:hypothetical protein
MIERAQQLSSHADLLLGISSDPFGSGLLAGLLPANPAGGSSSGSFRHVAAHGNKDGALAGGL